MTDDNQDSPQDPTQWMDNLPDPIKEAPYFKPQDDGSRRSVEQIVADLENAAKVQGNLHETHVRIPSHDAPKEKWDEFRGRVKAVDEKLVIKPDDYSPVPEAADGYKDPEIENFDAESANLSEVRAFAKEAGWNQSQYERYVETLAKKQDGAKADLAARQQANQTKLGEKLGAAKEQRLGRAAAALQDVLPEETLAAIREGAMDADVILAVDSLVEKMIEMGHEDSQFTRQANSGSRAMTPDEANAKVEELNEKMMNMNPGSAAYQDLIARRLEYLKLASATG